MATWIKKYRGKQYDQVHDCKNSIWSCDCSNCGWHTGQQGVNFKFCPNCGEKMENALCDDVMAKDDVLEMLRELRTEMSKYMDLVYAKTEVDHCRFIIEEKIIELKEQTDGK